jgi:hypothetical protein
MSSWGPIAGGMSAHRRRLLAHAVRKGFDMHFTHYAMLGSMARSHYPRHASCALHKPCPHGQMHGLHGSLWHDACGVHGIGHAPEISASTGHAAPCTPSRTPCTYATPLAKDGMQSGDGVLWGTGGRTFCWELRLAPFNEVNGFMQRKSYVGTQLI